MLPGPSGPEPQKSPKRVRKGVPAPPAAGSPRSPKECAPESEKSPKTQLRTLFRLFSDSGAHSLGTLGLPGAGGRGTPLWTLFGLVWGSGPEGPGSPLCQAGGFLTLVEGVCCESTTTVPFAPFKAISEHHVHFWRLA